ncbi:histamine H2 receptor-like [Periophthalmus magnuspinnatus]|uniref:histamine H2 receptor-like n=1 Tax=Periophthalmus magnuspinnatus TaxID=409849 RepID=UPI00145A7892|nr:histamine H2 receptor-like [Periophthalmus magnuspinnatus]
MIATALLWLALISHIIITIGGNVLVCLAVGLSRRLWRISNCFVVSLAITDLLLGLLVLPMSASVELRRGQWSLGGVLCNLYISVDVMLCTSSILTLMAISVDRYLAITAPLSYSRKVTTVRVIVATVAIWTCSLAVAFLPIHMGWNTADYSVQHLDWVIGDEDRHCLYEWNNSYVIGYACGTFYLPLLLMTGMYLCIFRVAREQARRIRAATPSFARTASTAAISREHKATVTLAAVLGAFVICWFPYFTYFTFMGMKGRAILPNTYHSIVLWLGYFNSALNPILYPAFNKDFHSAYRELLHCRRPSRKKVHLSNMPVHKCLTNGSGASQHLNNEEQTNKESTEPYEANGACV